MGPDLDPLIDSLGPERVCHLPFTRPIEAALSTVRGGVLVVSAPPVTAADVEVVAALRRRRPGVRALLLTEHEAAALRLHALALGFDDALPTDLGVVELAGRVELLARRATARPSPALPVGVDVELDLAARSLRRGGRLVHLRPIEFRLLEELARHPGRPIARSRLLERVWGGRSAAGSRTIDVHVRWLREKVERDPEHPVHLLTVRGVGYQLEPAGSGDMAAPIREQDVNGPVIGR
jgi:DNA-binding response OmpR family regulator